MSNQVVKPDFVDDETLEEYLNYLAVLEASGVNNMLLAGQFLPDRFPELDRQQAAKVLLYWIVLNERKE